MKRGFSLIEILVALGLMALLLTSALLNLGPFQARNELRAASQELFADLKYTREIAISQLGNTTDTNLPYVLECSFPPAPAPATYRIYVAALNRTFKQVTLSRRVQLALTPVGQTKVSFLSDRSSTGAYNIKLSSTDPRVSKVYEVRIQQVTGLIQLTK